MPVASRIANIQASCWLFLPRSCCCSHSSKNLCSSSFPALPAAYLPKAMSLAFAASPWQKAQSAASTRAIGHDASCRIALAVLTCLPAAAGIELQEKVDSITIQMIPNSLIWSAKSTGPLDMYALALHQPLRTIIGKAGKLALPPPSECFANPRACWGYYRDNVEQKILSTMVYWVSRGIMESKMETTTQCIGFFNV